MGKYIRYTFVNLEGLRIVNDHLSQHGEAAALKYVPGTTIRGLVISTIAAKGQLDTWKKDLFSEQTQFLNAYVCADEEEMIPSPKGFYEDKTVVKGRKEIQNVVTDGVFDDGMKRAGLGEYCFFKDGVINYASVQTASDLKIKINDVKRDVFRNEYITPGHEFVGYIRVEDDQLRKEIRLLLQEEFIIGNARSSGMGKCKCSDISETEKIPYEKYAVNNAIENECYLYIASDTCMRNSEGEYCGIDEDNLAKILGVENLIIKFASTSRRISGAYNRNWGGRTPAIPYFEKGSVFHLQFNGTISKDTLDKLMDEGIGINRNEGFGRILFLKAYPSVHAKEPVLPKKNEGDTHKAAIKDDDSIYVVAKNMMSRRIQKACEAYIISTS